MLLCLEFMVRWVVGSIPHGGPIVQLCLEFMVRWVVRSIPHGAPIVLFTWSEMSLHGRAPVHGVMGCGINPSWCTHCAIYLEQDVAPW